MSDKTVKEQKSPPKTHCCNAEIEDCTYTSRYAHNRCSKCKQLFPELKEDADDTNSAKIKIFRRSRMSTPKLKPGADKLILDKLAQLQGTDGQFALMQQAVYWTLENLPKLLEATHDFGQKWQGKENYPQDERWIDLRAYTKSVAVVEVE